MEFSPHIPPAGYEQTVVIDLKENLKLAIILNGAALVLTLLSLWAFIAFSAFFRPEIFQKSYQFKIDLAALLKILGFILLVALNLILHEGIHGAFFWFFTGRKPVYGLGLSYAYAAAPGYYLPRRPYSVIGLAPLLSMGIIGLVGLLILPAAWILPLALLVSFNTGGSIGDLWIIWRLSRLSAGVLVHDDGHCIRFYEPGTSFSSVLSRVEKQDE